MAEKKGRSIIYENLARRKDSLNTKFNNFTINPPTNPSMTVYQSGTSPTVNRAGILGYAPTTTTSSTTCWMAVGSTMPLRKHFR